MAELPTESIATLVERAEAAYESLAERAEAIEGEWEYVTDLAVAYGPAIRGLARGREAEPADDETVAAVDEAIAEIDSIADPYRAIDWLSTFPHVVALALGGDVDRPAGELEWSSGPSDRGEPDEPHERDRPDEPDDDSPFRILLGRR